MNRFSRYSLIISAALLPLQVHALGNASTTTEPFRIKTVNGYEIAGDYMAVTKARATALMLHQCNMDRQSWQALRESFAEMGLASVAVDYRGYGESATSTINDEVIRKAASSREDYFDRWQKVRVNWPSDMESVMAWMEKRKIAAPLLLIGASCGGGQAVILGGKVKPDAIILLSPSLRDVEDDQLVANKDIPMLGMATENDTAAVDAIQRAFEKNNHPNSALYVYKGDAHGMPLLENSSVAQSALEDWLKTNLAR